MFSSQKLSQATLAEEWSTVLRMRIFGWIAMNRKSYSPAGFGPLPSFMSNKFNDISPFGNNAQSLSACSEVALSVFLRHFQTFSLDLFGDSPIIEPANWNRRFGDPQVSTIAAIQKLHLEHPHNREYHPSWCPSARSCALPTVPARSIPNHVGSLPTLRMCVAAAA
jgi:hypothetical protein